MKVISLSSAYLDEWLPIGFELQRDANSTSGHLRHSALGEACERRKVARSNARPPASPSAQVATSSSLDLSRNFNLSKLFTVFLLDQRARSLKTIRSRVRTWNNNNNNKLPLSALGALARWRDYSLFSNRFVLLFVHSCAPLCVCTLDSGV